MVYHNHLEYISTCIVFMYVSVRMFPCEESLPNSISSWNQLIELNQSFFAENERHSRERRADAALGGGYVEQVQLHDGRAQGPQVIRVTFQSRF